MNIQVKCKKHISVYILLLGIVFLFIENTSAQDIEYLYRSSDSLKESTLDISNDKTRYYPLFGAGDADSTHLHITNNFGYLIVDENGASPIVNNQRIEIVFFVLEGTGFISQNGLKLPISKNDFFYLPINSNYGFENPRETKLSMLMMGYLVPDSIEVNYRSKFEIANVSNVEPVILDSHGETVTYELLLGPITSERDKIASAIQISSLFIMDFKPGGTNKPHKHRFAEEIYFVLQGTGNMVAGESNGEPILHPAKKGDSYYYPKNKIVGFYSTNESNDERARILAIRTVNSR